MQLFLVMYTALFHWSQSFTMHILWYTYIHGVALFLFLLPCPLHPLSSPLALPLTYLAPSSCDRTVLPLIRLLVDWPHLPLPSPNHPIYSSSRNPNSSTPDNDDIGATSLPLCGTVLYINIFKMNNSSRNFVETLYLRVHFQPRGGIQRPSFVDRAVFEPCLRFSGFQRHLFLCIPA